MRRLATLLLLVAALALPLAGCGGDDGETGAGDTTATETSGDRGNGNAANGKEVFATAGCGGCHTFSAAGSSGGVGPNLDDSSPSFDEVVEQVTNGGGAMPAFADELSEEQIRDVAAFVTQS
jgi:mono/diheme cytochrome c family protein